MIVKDESAIIERCLRSIVPVIDYWVICDTGSSDDTPSLVQSFFAENKVPGELHHIPFINFEVSRNHALDLCRKSAGEFNYILLPDADMELVVQDADFRSHLVEKAYWILQTDSNLSYYNLRLIQRNREAWYQGVTHEGLWTDVAKEELQSIYFFDHADGSNRKDKWKRDIGLLTEALKNDPDNSRYLFYLAQSYREAGKFMEALEYYSRRFQAGPPRDEMWYSLYMMAFCHKNLGDDAKFVDLCMQAYNYWPGRAEPLYHLAKHYRLQGNYEACFLLCEAAERIPMPEAGTFFVEGFIYRIGILEEMSISGFYCRDPARKQKGHDSCAYLATSRRAGEMSRETARRNCAYYVRKAADVFPGTELHQLSPLQQSSMTFMNPSLCRQGGKYFCIFRGVNYLLKDGYYQMQAQDDVIRTRNHFATLNPNFEIAADSEIRDLAPGPPRHDFPVQGFEDCRLFFCRERFWCSCTVRDRNPEGRCEIAILKLDHDRNVIEVQIVRSIGQELHQKNWVPAVNDDELYLIYATDPTTILKYDFDAKSAFVFHTSVPQPFLEFLRGGSQAIRLKNGWIYLTHENLSLDARNRIYLHRFIFLNDDFELGGWTDPFYFLHQGVEFCAGLAYDPESRKFLASFGVNDQQCWLISFDERSVFAQMHGA